VYIPLCRLAVGLVWGYWLCVWDEGCSSTSYVVCCVGKEGVEWPVGIMGSARLGIVPR
jgi:hypothetical protein